MIREFFIYLSAYIGLFAVIFYTLSAFTRRKVKKYTFNWSNAPFISVIIPAYNEEKGIASTIESALGLNYPKDKVEIIVVDDGSKDKTYEIAKKFQGKLQGKEVKVFTKKNGGKGHALNYGIARSKGEIIFTMDADSVVKSDSALHQVERFANPKVMCASPIVAVYKPRSILARIQQIEYFLGVFLREAFASLNAVHVTPGAFSAYRRSFFDKYGGFHENNLTEDFEMALKIQSHDYIIENSLKSVVYAKSPDKFKALMIQRKRWYIGLIRNLIEYKRLFSKNYGALGMVVLPIALTTILISVFLTIYLAFKALFDIRRELILLQSINFNIMNTLEFSRYIFSRFFFNVISNPIMLFMILFGFIVAGYMIFAKSKVKEHSGIALSLPLFLLAYTFLFAFWWTISFLYHLLDRKIKWR